MQSFFSRLQVRAQKVDSLLCVGLDPHPESLSKYTPEVARAFCVKIINACSPYVCAFKPNIAFFEALGSEGIKALQDVIAAIPDEIPVILDAKRGDIASTTTAYRRAVFDTLGAHAVTASPYLGRDALTPFLERPEQGVFVLCKTSNPGADDLQSLRVNGEPLYLHVARQANTWSEHNNLGLVIGATDTQALEKVRHAVPELWMLVPGVGMQGGHLAAALHAGLRYDGLGVLVNASRMIASAADCSEASAQLRDTINTHRKSAISPRKTSDEERLATTLIESGCVRFGNFTLKSGGSSPFYIDLRRLASFPDALQAVAAAFLPMLTELSFDRIAAIPYAALPIATAVSLAGGWPLIYARREVKEHGTQSMVEGVYQIGDMALVMDDLITTGDSKFETIQKLRAVGLRVRDIAVLIDREQGATAVLQQAGYRLRSVITISKLLEAWRKSGAIDEQQYGNILGYLSPDE